MSLQVADIWGAHAMLVMQQRVCYFIIHLSLAPSTTSEIDALFLLPFSSWENRGSERLRNS